MSDLKEKIAHSIALSSYRLVAKTLKLYLGIHLSHTTEK